MKRLMFVIVAVLLSLSSCELINSPVEDVIVEVVNKEPQALTDVKILVDFNNDSNLDLEDTVFDFGTIEGNLGNSTVIQQIEVNEKYVDIAGVEIASLNTTLSASDNQTVDVSIDNAAEGAEPVRPVDPAGLLEYHSFRALVKNDLKIIIEVNWVYNEMGDPLLNENPFTLWMGYQYPADD